GRKEPGIRALKDETAGRRQRAAARRLVIQHAPARTLADWIPRKQRARRTDRLTGARLVRRFRQLGPLDGHLAQREIDAEIPCPRLILERRIGAVRKAALDRRDIDEPGVG